MRPRVFPAEDADDVLERAIRKTASMRPRVFPADPAEDTGTGTFADPYVLLQ